MSNFMKIRPEGAEVVHMDRFPDRQIDRETDMKKLIVNIRNFTKEPKKLPPDFLVLDEIYDAVNFCYVF
jgi:hypothetical protein